MATVTKLNSKDQHRLENMQQDLKNLCVLDSSVTTPPKIQPLNGSTYRASSRPIEKPYAEKWQAHARMVMKKILLPLLKGWQRNFKVGEKHKADPRWDEFRKISKTNLEKIERKVRSAEKQWQPYW